MGALSIRSTGAGHSSSGGHARSMISAAWDYRRPAIATVLVLVGGAWLVWLHVVLSRTDGWGYDFQAYYFAAARLAKGESLYQVRTLLGPFQPGPWGLYLYQPPLGVLVLPLSGLDLSAATSIWYVVHAVVLVLACLIMPVAPLVRVMVFAAAAFSSSVSSDLALGNVSLLIVLPMAMVWRWLDRPLGSVGLALALTVRLPAGLFLVWWALRRQWSPIAWTIVAAAVVAIATLPFVGVSGWTEFLTMLRNLSGAMGVPNNQDIGSIALRSGLPESVATVLFLGGCALGVVSMAVALRRDAELGFMVTLGASLLISPLLWDHYLCLSLLTAAFLAQRWRWWAGALPLLSLVTNYSLTMAVAMTVLPLLARPRGDPAPDRVSLRSWLPSGIRGRTEHDGPGRADGPPQPAAETP